MIDYIQVSVLVVGMVFGYLIGMLYYTNEIQKLKVEIKKLNTK